MGFIWDVHVIWTMKNVLIFCSIKENLQLTLKTGEMNRKTERSSLTSKKHVIWP
jgi:hypothetical protein